MAHPLADAFLETCTVVNPDLDTLERVLRGLLEKAHDAYPHVKLDDSTFVRHLGARLEGEPSVLETLANIHANNLFLARACAAGHSSAILAFEEVCMRHAEGSVGRSVSRDTVEEAKQNVRERVLVGDGAPRILDYDGRGELRHWVRVAVVREALHLSKKADKEPALSFELFTIVDDASNPEVAFFKARYRSEYRHAFEAAITQLDTRQRSLLRQTYILGLNVDQIGQIYQVHRATAARWVQSAREELLSKARFELARRTGLSHAELESVVRMIESQLNVSLNRLLVSRSVIE